MNNKYYRILLTVFSNKKIFLNNLIHSLDLKPDNCWYRWLDVNNCGFEVNIDTKKISNIYNLNSYKDNNIINPNNIKNIINYGASILVNVDNYDLWIMTLNFKIYHYKYINNNYYYNYHFNNDIEKIFINYKNLHKTIFYKNFNTKNNFLNFKLPLSIDDLNKLKTINENLYNRVYSLLGIYDFA